MHSPQAFAAIVACAAIPTVFAAVLPRAEQGPTSDPEAILKQLQQAPTRIDKLNVLVPDPKDPHNLVYQFASSEGPNAGNGVAEVNTFPALDITDVALAVGTVGPCGLNLPHIHPRATEVFVVLDGTIEGGVVLEIGAGVPSSGSPAPPATVNTTLNKYVGTVFPQGGVHFQFNPTCKEATFFAAFDNKDPGFAIPGVPEEPVSMPSASTNGTKSTTKAKRGQAPPNTGSVGPDQLPKFRDQLSPHFVQLIENCAAKCGLHTGS